MAIKHIGDDLKLHCTSNDTVQWFYKTTDDEGLLLEASNDLVIRNIGLNTSGNYFCSGVNKLVKKHFLAKANLLIDSMEANCSHLILIQSHHKFIVANCR